MWHVGFLASMFLELGLSGYALFIGFVPLLVSLDGMLLLNELFTVIVVTGPHCLRLVAGCLEVRARAVVEEGHHGSPEVAEGCFHPVMSSMFQTKLRMCL